MDEVLENGALGQLKGVAVLTTVWIFSTGRSFLTVLFMRVHPQREGGVGVPSDLRDKL